MRRLLAIAVLVAAALSPSGSAFGQRTRSQAEAEIERLLNDARSYYDNLELDLCDRALERAIRLGVQFDVRTRALAEVYLQRGILVHVRDRDEQAAIRDFREALRIDPTVRLDPLISTPSLERLFEAALSDLPAAQPAVPPPVAAAGPDVIHTPVREARSGERVPITVEFGPSINSQVYRVYVFFRSARADSVQRVEMRPDGRQGFYAEIPGRFVAGSSLTYYIVAEDRLARPIGGVGSARDPIAVRVVGDALAGLDALPTGSSLVASDERLFDEEPRERHFVTLSISTGTGSGFITDRATPEHRPSTKVRAGVAVAPFHSLVELDFWATEKLALGAYARIQIVEFAHLEGGRIKYKALESGDHALIVRAGGGVGRVRHLVDLGSVSDTTLQGPYHYTIGATWLYAMSDTFALAISPDFLHLIGDSPSQHLDLNVGVQIGF